MPFYTTGNREVIAPVNVRVVTLDGSEIPVDCRYVGVDLDGMQCWETIFPYHVGGNGYGLRLVADEVPPGTRIDAFVYGERP
jgi:hypothetical protein